MSRRRLPPPAAEACLVRLRPSSQKGGTLIAEDVIDRAAHERRICNPDGYRPAFCPTCGETRLHVHDYRERILRAEPGEPVARVVRHVCVACAAIWLILPAIVARHLWRTWDVVEHAVSGAAAPSRSREAPRWPRAAARTRRRWRARWRRPAALLRQVLASSGAEAWATVTSRLGAEARCADLVAATGQSFAAFAALVHRLQPKVRLL